MTSRRRFFPAWLSMITIACGWTSSIDQQRWPAAGRVVGPGLESPEFPGEIIAS
jgi:hypothetical protein